VPPALEARRAQQRLLGWALTGPAVRGDSDEAPAELAKKTLEKRAAALEEEAAALRRLLAAGGKRPLEEKEEEEKKKRKLASG
jgi:hypothetical protein